MTAITEHSLSFTRYAPGPPAVMKGRVSLIAPNDERTRSWCDPATTNGLAILDDSVFTTTAVARALSDSDVDVARIVVDGGLTNGMFLQVLTRIPQGSPADVLWICDDESGYLSAVGRGGDRILYALTPEDVEFYLEVHGLVSSNRSAELKVLS